MSTTAVSTVAPYLHSMQTRRKSRIFEPKSLFPLSVSLTESEPTTFSQASKYATWKHAMANEYNALMTNNTWELVPFHPSQNLVGCKWVYKVKYHFDGTVERYKSRLVVQGFHQPTGLDYHKTFSLVVKPVTIHLILCLTITFNWFIHQLDVKNAFLLGHLNETVYMIQPRGFVHSDCPNHVCRLKKAIYGLKQAPRVWFRRISNFLLPHGFLCSTTNPSMFISSAGAHNLILLLYVDDIILTSGFASMLIFCITLLSCTCVMQDLGDLRCFLGIQVVQNSSRLFFHNRSMLMTYFINFISIPPNQLEHLLVGEPPYPLLMVNCLLILVSTRV